jgi:hypothetical protein
MDNTSAVAYINKMGGGDGVPGIERHKQGILALVHGEGHLCTSIALGREVECDGRQGIQGAKGQIRLDALPVSSPKDQPPTGTTGDRSIY